MSTFIFGVRSFEPLNVIYILSRLMVKCHDNVIVLCDFVHGFSFMMVSTTYNYISIYMFNKKTSNDYPMFISEILPW